MTRTLPRFTLRRLDSTPFATYGNLLDAEERLVCVTLERPWVDENNDGISDRNVSCIPPGLYEAYRRKAADTRHGYDVFELLKVPSRTNIQIHIFNLPHESNGCIGTGSSFGPVAGKPGIIGSSAAYRRFMDHLRGVDRIMLDVVAPPTLKP
jgi:hypothetical protein